MTARIPITDEQWRKARLLYERRPKVSVTRIAAMLGLSRQAFDRRIREKGWPLRAAAIVQQAKAETMGRHAAPVAIGVVAQALGRSVLAEIERLDLAAAWPREDPERTARVFSSLARTLAAARSLQDKDARTREGGRSARDEDDGDDDGGSPPRSLEELRDELARHLDRIVAEEEAAGSGDFLHLARACEAP